MSETEIEVVAKSAYTQATGRADWEDAEGPDERQRKHWCEIARVAIAALDSYRGENASRERAHMLSELSDLAHQGEGN